MNDFQYYSNSTINDWCSNRGGGNHSHWSTNDGTASGGCHNTNISSGVFSRHEVDSSGNVSNAGINFDSFK